MSEPVVDRMAGSREIDMRVKRALAAMETAKEYDSGDKRERSLQTQLWELARAQTAAFFETLVDGNFETVMGPPNAEEDSEVGGTRSSNAQFVANLETAQALLSGEM